MRFVLLFALLFLARLTFAQTNAATAGPAAPAPASKSTAPAKASHSAATTAELQKTVDQLTQSNLDLLDLLNKQQAVLQDMQFEGRQQSRRIESLEEHLEDTLYQNTQLQNKVARMEAGAAASGTAPVATTGFTNAPSAQAGPAAAAATPPPPATYLPLPESEGAPGTKSWHRLFTLKGEDGQQSDLFQVQGRTWRVLWHNLDKPGKAYQNTSGLFINAFPKNDTVPQRVSSKVGTGGDTTELEGPGNYYLKIEASGGSWELAVEDFR